MAENKIEEKLSESELKQFLNLGDVEYSSIEGTLIGEDDTYNLSNPSVEIYVDSMRYEVGTGYMKIGVIEKHNINDFIDELNYDDAGKIMSEDEFKELAKKYGYTVTQEDINNFYNHEKGEPLNAFIAMLQAEMFEDEQWITISKIEVPIEASEDCIREEEEGVLVFRVLNNYAKFISEEIDTSGLSMNLSDFVDIGKFNQIIQETSLYSIDMDSTSGRFEVRGHIYQ